MSAGLLLRGGAWLGKGLLRMAFGGPVRAGATALAVDQTVADGALTDMIPGAKEVKGIFNQFSGAVGQGNAIAAVLGIGGALMGGTLGNMAMMGSLAYMAFNFLKSETGQEFMKNMGEKFGFDIQTPVNNFIKSIDSSFSPTPAAPAPGG
jgi:hypothetical protein